MFSLSRNTTLEHQDSKGVLVFIKSSRGRDCSNVKDLSQSYVISLEWSAAERGLALHRTSSLLYRGYSGIKMTGC